MSPLAMFTTECRISRPRDEGAPVDDRGMRQLNFRVTPEELVVYKALADLHQVSVSELLRQTVAKQAQQSGLRMPAVVRTTRRRPRP